jgi:hypothetical protein
MLPNPNYAAEIERTRNDLTSGRAVLVYLDRYGRSRAYYPKAETLKKQLGLHVLARCADGTIFDYVPPTTQSTNSATTTPSP